MKSKKIMGWKVRVSHTLTVLTIEGESVPFGGRFTTSAQQTPDGPHRCPRAFSSAHHSYRYWQEQIPSLGIRCWIPNAAMRENVTKAQGLFAIQSRWAQWSCCSAGRIAAATSNEVEEKRVPRHSTAAKAVQVHKNVETQGDEPHCKRK